MKKTIAAMAILASASANALMPPGHMPSEPQPEIVKVCLSQYISSNDGSASVGSCDESMKNSLHKRKMMENGCAEGQVSMHIEANVIESCPAYMQL